ncbi:UNVERIFIED_CONTAM: Retrovirus-related Pol polyprotein from transposon TNT 1-94 [Sesamum calycinum]|uniref:Retrovirus-related Pol polyprotein from transposon TNT 1-94 n=1 Tax=Sesamum calycinum TaxID=2727403 RepID=A0AAW2IWV7_9LAMI
MGHGVKLSKKQPSKTNEELKRTSNIPYASAVQSIQYAIQCTKPDITGVVAWKSSKQATTTDSTIEAEYIAASEAANEAIWMKNYIQELGVVPSIAEPVVIFCDNNGAIAKAKELRSHHHSKQILRCYNPLRDMGSSYGRLGGLVNMTSISGSNSTGVVLRLEESRAATLQLEYVARTVSFKKRIPPLSKHDRGEGEDTVEATLRGLGLNPTALKSGRRWSLRQAARWLLHESLGEEEDEWEEGYSQDGGVLRTEECNALLGTRGRCPSWSDWVPCSLQWDKVNQLVEEFAILLDFTISFPAPDSHLVQWYHPYRYHFLLIFSVEEDRARPWTVPNRWIDDAPPALPFSLDDRSPNLCCLLKRLNESPYDYDIIFNKLLREEHRAAMPPSTRSSRGVSSSGDKRGKRSATAHPGEAASSRATDLLTGAATSSDRRLLSLVSREDLDKMLSQSVTLRGELLSCPAGESGEGQRQKLEEQVQFLAHGYPPAGEEVAFLNFNLVLDIAPDPFVMTGYVFSYEDLDRILEAVEAEVRGDIDQVLGATLGEDVPKGSRLRR